MNVSASPIRYWVQAIMVVLLWNLLIMLIFVTAGVHCCCPWYFHHRAFSHLFSSGLYFITLHMYSDIWWLKDTFSQKALNFCGSPAGQEAMKHVGILLHQIVTRQPKCAVSQRKYSRICKLFHI